MGRHFIIKIDHQPLKYLLDQKLTIPSQFTWLAKLMAYDYEIQYKHGKVNTVADALPRMSTLEVTLQAICSVSTDMRDRIKSTWQQDPKLLAIIQSLQHEQTVKHYS